MTHFLPPGPKGLRPPGGGVAMYVIRRRAGAAGRTPDEAAVVAMLARYGATVLGPPLS